MPRKVALEAGKGSGKVAERGIGGAQERAMPPKGSSARNLFSIYNLNYRK